MDRYLCIHCHFYQPPRENPWLEVVEEQDSAYPFHDWNERITAECYAPNSAARILTAANRVAQIVSNYSQISFNFGPTLLSWLQQNAHTIYDAILQADRDSQEHFGGHGSALAQVYNHMIMPLANPADKRTQVLWGIRDFEARFGRFPEGMWLAETAVDLETLDILAEAGIQFTILAPHQAARVRPLDGADCANGNGNGNGENHDWHDVTGGRIDPTRAYLQRLPSGRSINLFFYDGPISRAVAFERLLANGEHFAERLTGGFDDERSRPQLMHIATDGETYGHHHQYGDMALAYALHSIAERNLAQLTNYGQFLELAPPRCEVEIIENTSWSCVHGVERWRSDCGCNTGGHSDWNQQWRGPLRHALDWLRDAIAPRYEEAARSLLADPWRARDEYIHIVLDRSPENVTRFFSQHAARPLQPEERTRALQLLEMQRHAMLMYTSCGWFFDELSGIETVQVILYAGRAVQLAEEVFGESFAEPFLARLEAAHSNLPENGTGRDIYLKWVKPATLSLPQVGAHYAISALFSRSNEPAPIPAYTAARLDFQRLESGRAKLAIGRALITSRVTEANEFLSFGVLHFGDNHLSAGVRIASPGEPYATMVEEVRELFERGDLAGTVRALDSYFGGLNYSLKSLFRDEQRRILNLLLDSVLSDAEGTYRQLYEAHAPLMRYLAELEMPLPRVLHISAEFVVNSALRREFSAEDPDVDRVAALLASARSEKLTLDGAGLGYVLRKRLDRAFATLQDAPQDLGLLARVTTLIEMVRKLPFTVNLWRVQNIYYQLLQGVYPGMRTLDGEEGRIWTQRFERLGELLNFEMPAAVTAVTAPEVAA
jgi:alpha-amylase/alpha-mannosidase (GH57 family)